MAESQLMTKEMTCLPLDVKAAGDAGSFEGYGAIFGNLDRDGDVVSRGAFSESLKGRMPALLWQHNAKEPIGRFDVVREDAKGLYVKGRLSMEGRGREAYELLKMGALDGLSIGFVTKEASRDPATGTRAITKADLMEISLVTFPANDLARVSTVKSSGLDPRTPRDFERFLRENGFSRSRAKAITAKGFGCSSDGYATDDVVQLVNNVEECRTRLIDGNLLQRKRFSISSGAKAGNKAAMIREALGEVASAYKAVRPTAMPLYIQEGGSAKFSLGLLGNRSGSRIVASHEREISAKFRVEISYWDWSAQGPRWRTETVPNGGKSPFVVASADFGSLAMIERWLGKEWDALNKNNALDRFDHVLERLGAVIDRGIAPRGKVYFDKLVAAQTVPINVNPGATAKVERRFTVKVQ